MASTTLDDIINELKLNYDPSIGLLDGESLHSIPSLNTLLNLHKLFAKLASQLRTVEKVDESVLAALKGEKRKSEGKKRLTLKLDKKEKPKDTIPADAITELGLFSEEGDPNDKEFLKRKYGVACYPENDLLDLLPGTIPDIDFSKNKNTGTQVLFSTFQTYIESYFRPFTNEDVEFLSQGEVIPPGFENHNYDPNVTPYLIPRLRRFYAEAWAEEDPNLAGKLSASPYSQPPEETYKAKGTTDDITDNSLYTEDVSCGPLSNRILSAILGAKEGPEPETKEEDAPSEGVPTKFDSEEYKIASEVNDFSSLEDRLKRELKFIGIFMNLDEKNEMKRSIVDSEDWIKNREDDEVCAEIRSLQKTLRETVARNRINKRRLIPIVEEHLAYQEYCAILEDLDKQVDQAYMKRLKGKSKKRKLENPIPPVNTGLKALLEKRKRWIDNIGRLFEPAEVMKRVPKEDVLVRDVDVEEEEESQSTFAKQIIEEL